MYFIHQRIRFSHEKFRFWSILLLDVFIMKIIHQSFWDIEDWHPKINWLVENKFRFFHVHCNEIFSEDCRSFIIRFRNKLFSWFIIRSESDIHPVSTIPQHLQLFKAVEFDCSKSDCPIPHNSLNQNQAVEFDCSKSDYSIPSGVFKGRRARHLPRAPPFWGPPLYVLRV